MALRMLLSIAILVGARLVAAEETSTYRIVAAVDTGRAEISGRVEITFDNHSAQALSELVLVLFANRFAAEEHDGGINDFNRPYVYPYQDFDPGWMKLDRVRVGSD